MIQSIMALFSSEKASFLVTLFFSALAWTISMTTNRYENVALIEYQIYRSKPMGQLMRYKLSMTNISSTQVVECMQIFAIPIDERGEIARFDSDDKMPLPVSVDGTSAVKSSESIDKASGNAVIELSSFHPLTKYQITLSVPQPVQIRLQTLGCESGQTKPESGTRPVLRARSVETFVVEHSLSLLWGGLFLWGLLMLGLAWFTVRTKQVILGEGDNS